MAEVSQTASGTSFLSEAGASLSRTFFALGIIGIGIQQVYLEDFVPVILPSFPSSLPFRPGWIYGIAAILVFAGIGILIPRAARLCATALGVVLLALLVVRHIPVQLGDHPRVVANWTNAFKILTLAGGAFIVAASTSTPKSGITNRAFIIFGTFTLAITCIVFGTDHFLYAPYVAPLVPAWIPWHMFWTYFCGAALIASGLGMITRILPRLAAGMLGGTIFIWLIVLHIPRAIVDPHSGHGNEITSVFEALAFSGIAFLLAASKN